MEYEGVKGQGGDRVLGTSQGERRSQGIRKDSGARGKSEEQGLSGNNIL